MAAGQALAKGQGALLPLWRGGTARNPARGCRQALQQGPREGDRTRQKRLISVLSRVWHTPCMSSCGPNGLRREARPFLVSGLRLTRTRKTPRTGPAGRFLLRLKRRCSASALLGFPSGARPLAGPPLRARLRACGPSGRSTPLSLGGAGIGRASERKADWPPAGARTPHLIRAEEQRQGRTRGGGCANQIASSSCCNSPASNISIMISLPPTNSPFT